MYLSRNFGQRPLIPVRHLPALSVWTMSSCYISPQRRLSRGWLDQAPVQMQQDFLDQWLFLMGTPCKLSPSGCGLSYSQRHPAASHHRYTWSITLLAPTLYVILGSLWAQCTTPCKPHVVPLLLLYAYSRHSTELSAMVGFFQASFSTHDFRSICAGTEQCDDSSP